MSTNLTTEASGPPAGGALRDALLPLLQDRFGGDQRALHVPAAPGGFLALLAWALRTVSGGTVVWVCDGAATLERRHRDFFAVGPTAVTDEDPPLLYFPERESFSESPRDEDPEIVGQRVRTLASLQTPRNRPRLLATCAEALMQRTLAPYQLMQSCTSLAVDGEADFDATVRRLVTAGYAHAVRVQVKGQIAVKGGVIDVWCPSELWPVRIEFFGDEVASMRWFDPSTQRSRDNVARVDLLPASEAVARDGAADGATAGPLAGAVGGLIDYLPANTVVVWDDRASVREHAAVLEETLAEQAAAHTIIPLASCEKQLAARPGCREVVVGGEDDATTAALTVDVRPIRTMLDLRRDVFDPDVMETERQRLFDRLAAWASEGWRIVAFFATEGGRQHFGKRLQDVRAEGNAVGEIMAALSEGFLMPGRKLAVVTEADLIGGNKQRASRYDPRTARPQPGPAIGDRLADLSALEPGDLVVHAEHGLGIYRGLAEIRVSGQTQEVMTIEYADEAKLHVPVTHAHLLSRYVGTAKTSPRLHRLGGRRWTREKGAAEEAVRDLAASLLETQARRQALSGRAMPADTPWQREFELLFPYHETPDQDRAIRAVKTDLESPRPADRLICGDAGYGKTEVAMRAAFKTVMAGQQVALLVPTTVLAQQHYDTFIGRMAAFPLRVEMLSRFRSGGQRSRILAGLKDGSVDIVIGTHALVQPTVAFKNLGLVIIDEEQRFGVKHKEQLKQVREQVDVLTMTATPIPRTLYMSLTGARDMSLIQTPPRERVAIETIATRLSDEILRRAILRELNREGQAFYLHNRVMTIDKARRRIERVVPEARVAVAHGQMRSGELSDIMHAFVSGRYDVLACTTIVESGVDIPRVNTILIDRADRFGIAELYQLRGRVGRSSHKAYAYLLLPERGPVDADARRRVNAVKRHSHLGAGFSLAMKDLEIRGAGNILGARQSGHIAAVGFGLYCQLLGRSVARLNGNEPPDLVQTDLVLDFLSLAPTGARSGTTAAIPYSYIDDEGQRMAVYHRLAQCATLADIERLAEDLGDRFGPLPEHVQRLLRLAQLRVIASGRGIQRVDVRKRKVRLLRDGEYVMVNGRFPRLAAEEPDARIEEIIRLVKRVDLPPGKDILRA